MYSSLWFFLPRVWNSVIRSFSQLKHEIQCGSDSHIDDIFFSHCSWLWFLSTYTYLSWTTSIISCASLGLTSRIPCLRDLFTHSDSVVLVNICGWLKAQFWLLTSLNLITQTPRASLWLTTYETAMQLLKYVILLHYNLHNKQWDASRREEAGLGLSLSFTYAALVDGLHMMCGLTAQNNEDKPRGIQRSESGPSFLKTRHWH